ncbi:SDR family NAD(P)-dependent oxidoreductase [Agromyces aerolatus]|uniref:SDR family NAD(P)-dependent oxidoreductase n=1 Tax=Agromyces sp. LY-1074 TaxID=3074080 RepID=UPI002856E4C9|nr:MULTISPECIES: SDR family NAD(P)-dependent oxidoreductase [unclassified Agromyces]MDR5699748.1 SDR family NAD(P)-dependent oxidoreductase [Agromyces sp. LY-1074]MDR5706044.1 SDR family NAD(P)-dependent oxidoreductase [Agromyces sp. LY-1358]
MKVANSVVAITGGASGLGEGTARMVVAEGGRAVLFDLPTGRGEPLAAELGERVLFVPVDITEPAQVEQGVAAAIAEFGRIDVLVNAAGISPAHRLVNRRGEMFPLDTFRKALDVNLVGLIDVSRHVAKAMTGNEPGANGERGLIVNVSSVAAFEGQMGQAAYTASKGAVAQLTLQLARDLAEFGIRVMAIAPGIMDTPMLASIDEARRERLMDLHLFPKRLGTAQDFATLVRTFMEVELLNAEVVRLDAGARMG